MKQILEFVKPFKTIIILSVLCVAALFAFSACQTAHGFGKDMEGAGKDIQRETK